VWRYRVEPTGDGAEVTESFELVNRWTSTVVQKGAVPEDGLVFGDGGVCSW
jgi:hypothetical protein